MKRAVKFVSVLLSALTVSAAMAASASALYYTEGAKIWKDDGKSVTIEDKDDYIFYNGSWYRKVDAAAKKDAKDYVLKKSTPVSSEPTKAFYSTRPTQSETEKPGLIIGKGTVVKSSDKDVSPIWKTKDTSLIKGGRYYTKDEAKVDLQKYFNDNSYDVTMYMGEERSFGADAQLFSTDPSVVYYNEKTGKLVAKNHGTAEVYVYTSGAIPFYRLDVCVVNPFTPKKTADVLYVEPDDWQLSVGDTTYFSVTSASGRKYDDVVFSVWSGKGFIGAKTGKFTADANGPVVVRAYSKSNSNICGEALIYVGSRFSAVSYDGWSACKDGVSLKEWSFDGSKPWYVDGWIKGLDGVYIPVVKMIDVTYTDFDGSKVDSKALTGGVVSYADLLREAYGDKTSVKNVLDRYNVFKYGKLSKDLVSYQPDPTDYQILLFARMIGAFAD